MWRPRSDFILPKLNRLFCFSRIVRFSLGLRCSYDTLDLIRKVCVWMLWWWPWYLNINQQGKKTKTLQNFLKETHDGFFFSL
jgi:hypothetical protein